MNRQTAPNGTDLWVIDTDSGSMFLALADKAAYMGKASVNLDDVAGQLDATADTDAVLKGCKKILHKKTISVVGSELDLKLTITYHSLKASLSSHGIAKEEITVENKEVFDALLQAFDACYGEDSTYVRKAYSPGRALVAPIVAVVIVGLFTWFFSSFSPEDEFNPTGRHRAMKELLFKLIQFLGPTGVIIVGGLIVLGCAYWGYKRAQNPPIYVTVKPGKSVKKK